MKTLITTLSLALAGLLANSAMAADATGPKPDMSACKADAEKLCPGIQPGGGRLKACFKEHKKDLSADCKKEMGAARKAKKDE
jgi:hypothetical protein